MKLSRGVTILDFFSGPAITLRVASSISASVIESLSFLAARRAASLRTFSRSAPVKPRVVLAIRLISTSGPRGLFFE